MGSSALTCRYPTRKLPTNKAILREAASVGIGPVLPVKFGQSVSALPG